MPSVRFTLLVLAMTAATAAMVFAQSANGGYAGFYLPPAPIDRSFSLRRPNSRDTLTSTPLAFGDAVASLDGDATAEWPQCP